MGMTTSSLNKYRPHKQNPHCNLDSDCSIDIKMFILFFINRSWSANHQFVDMFQMFCLSFSPWLKQAIILPL